MTWVAADGREHDATQARPAAACGDADAGVAAANAPPRVDGAPTALIDLVRQTPLRAHFSRATLAAAEALAARRRAWHGSLAWFRPDGSDAQALQCAVTAADGRLACATVCVYASFGRTRLDTACSCAQPRCEHAAALLVRVQQLLDWPRAMTPLQRWRHAIERMPATVDADVSSPVPGEWSLRCLLAVEGGVEPGTLTAQLVAFPAHDRDAAPRPADDARVRANLSREATLWLARLNATQRRTRTGAARYTLRGRTGAEWLAELLAAGVCRDTSGARTIRSGAPRAPQWRWRHDREANARLAHAWPAGADVHLFELDGLHYFDETQAELGRVDLGLAAWQALAQMPPVPPDEAAAFAARWPPHEALAAIPPPPAPPPLRALAAPLRAVVLLGASRHAEGGFAFHVRAFAQYAGHRIGLAEAPHRREIVRADGDGYARIRRDVDAEWQAWQALRAAGFAAIGEVVPGAGRVLSPAPDAQALAHCARACGGAETFVAVHAELQKLAGADWQVELDPDLPFHVLPPDTPLRAALDAGGQPGSTHFQLAVDVDGEEIDILPIVLDGYARRAFSLVPSPGEAPGAHWLAPLGAQRWLPVPLARLREWLAPLVDCLGRDGAGAPRDLAPAPALALHETLRAQGFEPAGARATDLARLFATLRAAREPAPAVAPPASFLGTLRPYQHDGLRWLQSLRAAGLGGVLADDMGLGKTVQVIAHLCVEHAAGRLDRPALVVAPTSLVFNWLEELARFAPSLRCLDFTGSARAALYDDLPRAEVVVTSYALLTHELARLESLDFALVVFDEAQWIKNPRTRIARATRRLCATHRLAVTGTPLENHLGELWAHFDAVLPGYLGDARTFDRTFRVPIERHEDDARRAVLRRRIAPFLLRREKAQVTPELPAKIEVVLRVAMGEAQRNLYEALRLAQSARVREALDGGDAERSRILVLSALLRLRQACCDPRLLPGAHEAESAKLAALLDLVRTLRAEGRRIVVFSQFTSMLALIAAALEQARLGHDTLTGDTRDRAAPVQRFQRGETPILLASLKAGGVGLNLTVADAVVHYDPWWNPAVERQAVDRAHRIGRDAPVLVYKLLCTDTIEERIEAMKHDKGELAVALLDRDGAPAAPLDEAEVRRLFDLPTHLP